LNSIAGAPIVIGCLRSASLSLFGQLSTDTTLPRVQSTAREPVSGATFTSYADELSKSYAPFLAE